MSQTTAEWPPLIVATKRPALMWVRDFLITVVMWTLFALMLTTTFTLFSHSALEYFGFEFRAEANWAAFLGRLEPYVLTTCALLASLCIAGLVTIRRRRKGLLAQAPALLDLADDADRASMGVGELLQARSLRSAVVNVDDAGIHRVIKP